MIFKQLKNSILFKTIAGKTALALFLLLVIFSVFYWAFVVPYGVIARGVSAGGVSLGRMTQKEAETAILEHIEERASITVYSVSGAEVSFVPQEIGLLTDAEKTADEAYKIGRSGRFFEDMGTLLKLYFSPKDFGQKYTVDEEKLGRILYDLGASQLGELKNYILEFGDGFVNVQKGTAGQSHDVSREINDFMTKIEKGETRILLDFQKSEPPEPSTESLFDEVYIEPKDARYQIADGKVVFFEESYGRQIDKIEAGTKITNIRAGETVTLPLVTLSPLVSLEALKEQLFNYTLGEFSTVYSTANRSRSKNVERAAEKINGTVLAPGEEFSYNGVVGRRTAENGFFEAQMYENGETVLGLGGGVCQVSSTLYCAVLYSGLETTERRNHSMTVGYVPKGQDATVSYGTIDYKFKNSTAYPIKISAAAKSGTVTISISGTKPETERTVKIRNTVLEVTEPTVSEIPAPELLTGNKRVISKGKTGYVVRTERLFYENGIETKVEDLGRSVYKMVQSKVAIGTKVPEPLPTLEPLETPLPTELPQDMEVE